MILLFLTPMQHLPTHMICAENLEFQFFPHTIFLRNHVSYVLSSRVFTNFSRRTKVSMHYPPMQCEEGKKKSFRHIGMLSKKITLYPFR